MRCANDATRPEDDYGSWISGTRGCGCFCCLPITLLVTFHCCSSVLTQTIRSECCLTEDICLVDLAEAGEVTLQELPPLRVRRCNEAHGPVRAGHEAIGAEGFDYGV